jgi:hypothetical protein
MDNFWALPHNLFMDTQANQPTAYRVPEENLSKLQERIAKLAKSAAKLNVPAPAIVLGEVETLNLKDKDGIPYVRVFQHLTLAGMSVVKLNGWTLAAVLEPVVDEDGTSVGNLLRGVPEAPTVPVSYRTAGNNCDHCQTARRRNETFLVVNEAGEWKQIGRQCLRDFLGHVSAERYADWAQMLLDAADFAGISEEDDFGGGSNHVARKWDITEVLSIAAAAIRLTGWRSRKTAELNGSTSTSGNVHDWLTYTGANREKHFEHMLIPNEADTAFAQEVAGWLATLSERNLDNDFMYNLSLLGRVQIVNGKQLGILCAAVNTFAKEKEREINRRKRFEADLNSQFVGEAGKRIVFVATVVYTNTYENQWGVSHLYKMKTPEGNIVSTFASNSLSNFDGSDVVVGNTVKLKGTVKAHEERDGVKQTLFSRVALGIEPTKEQKKAESKVNHIIWKLQTSGTNNVGYDEAKGDAIGIMSDIQRQISEEIFQTAKVSESKIEEAA